MMLNPALCSSFASSSEASCSTLPTSSITSASSSSSSSCATPLPVPSFSSQYTPGRVFTTEQLEVLDIIVHPLWIFDIVERRMRWVNKAGLELWNGSTREAFLNRSFRKISQARINRCEELVRACKKGRSVTDEWIIYPKTQRGTVKTVPVAVSIIQMSNDDDHVCLLCEALPQHICKEDEVQGDGTKQKTRGGGMLPHLPMAVCQFDMQGQVMYQNYEATLPTFTEEDNFDDDLYGETNTDDLVSSTETTVDTPVAPTGMTDYETPIINSNNLNLLGVLHDKAGTSNPNLSINNSNFKSGKSSTCDSDENSVHTSNTSSSFSSGTRFRPPKDAGDLISRFEDPVEGQKALEAIQTESSFDIEAVLMTRNGPKPCIIQLRKSSDPVTCEDVILFSALDHSDAHRADKERRTGETKSKFFAIMAHEIRTPLHQVTGFIDLLSETKLTSEQQSFVNLLKISAKGLMTVINDVLDFSKLEAGKMKLESIPFEPLSVVQGSIAVVQQSCEDQHIDLKIDWDKNIPFHIIGDPNRLRQVMLNLLSNAVKFTIKGGICVQVSSVKEPRPMLKLIVEDTGIGLAREKQRGIFRQYQQADASIARQFGGTGLGLSICQLLIEKMGGSIGVESELGKGSSFWFTIPADIPSNMAAEKISSDDEGDETNRNDPNLHVLVAEDNKVNQKLIANMLSRMGHTCDLAVNGKEAINMVRNGHYDVCLMDIQMPIMDGLEATRRLRTMGYNQLPIFGLTASVARADFKELGFTAWITKPIPMKDLKLKLREASSQV